MAKRHRMTPARRAALRKAQVASARKRRIGVVGGIAVSAAALGIAAHYGHKSVKRHRSEQFRKHVRKSMYNDPQQQHNRIHIRAHHLHLKGRHPLRPREAEVLKHQLIFTRKIAKQRVAKRKAMTSKQRRKHVMQGSKAWSAKHGY